MESREFSASGYVPAKPFNGRQPIAECVICGEQLARLSIREWVDALDNKASESPNWHEHEVDQQLYQDDAWNARPLREAGLI